MIFTVSWINIGKSPSFLWVKVIKKYLHASSRSSQAASVMCIVLRVPADILMATVSVLCCDLLTPMQPLIQLIRPH